MDSISAVQSSLALPRRRGLPVSERRLALIATDVASAATAFVVAFNLHSAEVRTGGLYLPRSGTLITVALWLVCAQALGAFDLRRAARPLASIRASLSVIAATAAGMLATFFVAPYAITRPTILLWLPAAALIDCSLRLAFAGTIARGLVASGVLLVGDAQARSRWSEMESEAGAVYHLAATVDPEDPEAPALIDSLTAQRGVDHIVLGVHGPLTDVMFATVLAAHTEGVRVRTLADVYEEATDRLLLDHLDQSWIAKLPMRENHSPLYAVFKRSADVAVGSAALLALGLTLPVVWVASRLSGDRGPLFYRQPRVGLHCQMFHIVKLRTMTTAGETTWTARSDRRVTRVGRWLRRLHLDELPQGWAIVKGDMSIIGPRPEQPHYVRELRAGLPYYDTRHSIRPGLTGWAQVNQDYPDSVEGARVKLSYDLYYVNHQSAALDLLILARTVVHILRLGGR